MMEIKLSQGKVALVDDADYAAVSIFKWYAICAKKKPGIKEKWYARRFENGRTIYMHRQLMNPGRGEVVDHWDGDGLNNQRSTNLKNVTEAKNTAHTRFRRSYFEPAASEPSL